MTGADCLLSADWRNCSKPNANTIYFIYIWVTDGSGWHAIPGRWLSSNEACTVLGGINAGESISKYWVCVYTQDNQLVGGGVMRNDMAAQLICSGRVV